MRDVRGKNVGKQGDGVLVRRVTLVSLLFISFFLVQLGTVFSGDMVSSAPGDSGDVGDLVGWWTFDEGSGLMVHDSSGYGSDGMVYGATWTSGISGCALEFDGDDYVEIPSSEGISGGTGKNLTVEVWFRGREVETAAFGHAILSKSQSGWLKDYILFPRNSSLHFQFENGGNNGPYVIGNSSGGILQNGVWYHAVVTWDAGKKEVSMYINGTRVASLGTLYDMPDTGDPLYIGRKRYEYNNNETYFRGTIDEVRIYNKVLSGTEIKERYDSYMVPHHDEPDFYVEANDISFSPEYTSAGDTLTVSATIHNLGGIDATATVTFYDGDPSSPANNSTVVLDTSSLSIPASGTRTASSEWVVPDTETHVIYVIVSNCQPREKTEDNNIAYRSFIAPLLRVVVDDDVVYIEEGQDKDIVVQVYCYNRPLHNVSIRILDSDNCTVEPIPRGQVQDLQPSEYTNFLINIQVTEFSGNETGDTRTIVVQATSSEGIESNVAYITLVIAQSGGLPPLATVLAVTSGGLGILAALFLVATETGKYKLFTLLSFFIPLFTRVEKDGALDHFVRGRIYGYLEAHPGAHYNEILGKIGVKNGTLSYHLHMLEKLGMVTSRREGVRHRVFYPTGIDFPGEEKYRLTDLQIAILGVIQKHEGISQTGIADMLGEDKQKISYNVKALQRAGKITVKQKGRTTHCYPK